MVRLENMSLFTFVLPAPSPLGLPLSQSQLRYYKYHTRRRLRSTTHGHAHKRKHLKISCSSSSYQQPKEQHLPPHAYTKLHVDDTPICRLLTCLDDAPSTLSSSYQHLQLKQSSNTLTEDDSLSMPTATSPTIPGNSVLGTGSASPESSSLRLIADLVDAGFHTFDIQSTTSTAAYAIRNYLNIVPASTTRSLQLCTHLHIEPSRIEGINQRVTVEKLVDRELLRFKNMERIHLLQISWHDLRDERYIEFFGELQELKKLGKIQSIGTLNFPIQYLLYLISQNIYIASNQVPLSFIDTRSTIEMSKQCSKHNISLLAGSTLLAGFIHERFIGMPQPSLHSLNNNVKLKSTLLKIKLWGDWSLFQELLYSIHLIANKYQVSMSNIAIKWALQQLAFDSVIVDPPISNSHFPHVSQYLQGIQAFQFELDQQDISMLEDVMRKGNDLHQILGDCGQEFQPYHNIL